MLLTDFGVNAILNLNSLRALKVLFVIVQNSDSNGEAKITLTDIAKKLNINHKSNVSISISDLESLNFIAIDTIKGKNIYILNPDFFITEKPYPIVLEHYKKVKEKRKRKEKDFDDNLFDELLEGINNNAFTFETVGDSNV